MRLLPWLTAALIREGANTALANKLREIPTDTRKLQTGSNVFDEHPASKHIAMVVSGIAARISQFHDAPFVASLYTTGMVFNFEAFHFDGEASPVVTKTVSIIEYVEVLRLRAMMPNSHFLDRTLLRGMMLETCMTESWAIKAKSLRATSRVANLVCELAWRERCSLGSSPAFHFPLAQKEVARMLGYSPVHLSRAIQELRDRRLVRWEEDWVKVLDADALVKLGQFSPAYLESALRFAIHPATHVLAAE
ncbi:Crp/Fnr family transcriptional regulator [Paracoccus laeviglucosivorans]|uniref:cAMP-binding domain of CRP or a regulatory subunit of cAMP-dependent protein kinases n=1 Tax=Paracoccus laeviglucosivorans TaxID=1197861 RepID=A0A521FQS7_9RHOB|nr:Crp/Fnr family transcriptional regulator [Paracoccus laeviglucosivorans]SMO98575.1 cAMP-binding domain of CRP or a regulatory subunit of cAMP-dependent protein kinases [Paracoccus laeviglucosivorans]